VAWAVARELAGNHGHPGWHLSAQCVANEKAACRCRVQSAARSVCALLARGVRDVSLPST